jgi:uncharacterized integral membrane protein
MRLVLIVLVILMGLIALFAIQNPGMVTVNFFNYYAETSILVVIVAAFGAGIIVGFLPGIPSSFKRKRRLRELESALAEQRKEPPSPLPPPTP